MKPTTIRTDLQNLMFSHICNCLLAADFSSTSDTIEDPVYPSKTLSWHQEDMIILLKRIVNEGIQMTMAEQITTLENILTVKMEIQLTQRMVTTANTQTAHMNLV